MRYDSANRMWTQAGGCRRKPRRPSRNLSSASRAATSPRLERHRRYGGLLLLSEPVNDMGFANDAWFAATDQGLLRSEDHGENWALLPLGPLPTLPVRSVRVSADGENLWIVSLRGMVFSHDAGKTWSWHDLPESAGGAVAGFCARQARRRRDARSSSRKWTLYFP